MRPDLAGASGRKGSLAAGDQVFQVRMDMLCLPENIAKGFGCSQLANPALSCGCPELLIYAGKQCANSARPDSQSVAHLLVRHTLGTQAKTVDFAACQHGFDLPDSLCPMHHLLRAGPAIGHVRKGFGWNLPLSRRTHRSIQDAIADHAKEPCTRVFNRAAVSAFREVPQEGVLHGILSAFTTSEKKGG